MANIQNELNALDNAAYGADVRTAIRNALYYLNEDNESLQEFVELAERINLQFDILASILEGTIASVENDQIETLHQYALYDQQHLESASFPNVLTIEARAFSLCSALRTINVPKATVIGTVVFSDCDALEELLLPSVTSLGYRGIASCNTLQRITLGSESTETSIVIYEGGIYNNNALDSVTIYGPVATVADSGMSATKPIEGLPNHIYVPEEYVDSYKSDADWSYYASIISAIS